MTPGRLLLSIRSKYGDGLTAAYYRDYVRPRIIDSPPIRGLTSDRCEIHVLTSASDWLNLLWALKTFYSFSRRKYRLCIHEDGSLPVGGASTLLEHFPDARLIWRVEADQTVLPRLPVRSTQLRRTNTLSLKVFDFAHYLRSDRLLLIDSDVLFFEEPTELLRRIEDPECQKNSVNPDIASAYTVDSKTVSQRFGFPLQPLFNSGLGLIHAASLNFDWIEEFLELPGIVGHPWRIEQTLLALCSSRYGVDLLPDNYRVHLGESSERSPCRHYIGGIRYLMYREGIRRLVRTGFLKVPEQAA